MNKPFTFSVSETSDNLFYVVKVSGELRMGKQLEADPDWKKLKNLLLTIARRGKVVVFDLVDMVFWDTQGITETLGDVVQINKSFPGRAAVISPKEPFMKVLAERQYRDEIGTKLIPWQPNLQDLENFLKKN